MDLGLTGRVAVIGGGSKGLGRACADSLSKEGANLVICSRNAEDLDHTAKEINSTFGVDVLPVAANLSRLEDIQTLIKATVDHFGRSSSRQVCRHYGRGLASVHRHGPDVLHPDEPRSRTPYEAGQVGKDSKRAGQFGLPTY